MPPNVREAWLSGASVENEDTMSSSVANNTAITSRLPRGKLQQFGVVGTNKYAFKVLGTFLAGTGRKLILFGAIADAGPR